MLDAVAFVASFGHRFLPLYTFDWETGDWHYDHSCAAARGLVPNNVVGNPGGRVKTDNGFQSYMAFAHCLAESLATACSGLSSTRAARRIPKGVDPELVYFLV